MDKIVIKDLEVQARVGVTEAERAQLQRLLITVEIEFDTSAAGRADAMESTVDYTGVVQLIGEVAAKKSRNLIEAVAEDIAQTILTRQLTKVVTVEVKKFSVARAQYVSVQITRPQ